MSYCLRCVASKSLSWCDICKTASVYFSHHYWDQRSGGAFNSILNMLRLAQSALKSLVKMGLFDCTLEVGFADWDFSLLALSWAVGQNKFQWTNWDGQPCYVHLFRGSTQDEAVFIHASVGPCMHPYSLTQLAPISGAEWNIFLKSFGDIPGMFVDYFLIIPNFLYVC